MKTYITLFLFVTSLTLTHAQIVDIPDVNFKAVLIDLGIDTNNDGDIQVSEAESISSLELNDGDGPVDDIASLEGIESFVNLTLLQFNYTQVTSLDLSNNVILERLECPYNNLITNLNLSQNTQLVELDCSYNYQLTALDLTQNTQLTELNCSNNQLTALDLSQNTQLVDLRCGDNQLTTLDLSQNTQLVNLYCEYNQLTALNLSGSPLIEFMRCSDNQLTTLNLSQNTQLENLYCSDNQLTALDLSSNAQLLYLNCPRNLIPSLDLSQNTQLVDLSASNNPLTSIDLTQNIDLEHVYISDGNMSTIDITNNVNLKELYINECGISNLDLTQNVNLEVFYCTYNSLTVLDVTQNINLLTFYCIGNDLTSLDVSQNVNLDRFNCSNNQLTNIDLSSNTVLTDLTCSNNPLLELDLSPNILLEDLWCDFTNLTSLDVSANEALYDLNCTDNDDLVSLFIKNGRTSNNTFYNFDYNPNLAYICADEFNFEYIISQLEDYEMTGVTVNSYCSFEPGGEFYTLEGQAQYDSNADGCDANDSNFSNLSYNITDGSTESTFISDATGNYTFPLQAGTYSITPNIENPSYFTLSPSSLDVDFPSDGSPFSQDFCISPNGTINDLEVLIIPLSDARPGFQSHYRLIYKNKGTTTRSGYVELEFSDNIDVSSYENASPSEDSILNGVVTWNYTDLEPFESRAIDVTLNLNTPTDPDNPLNGGDVLSYNATVFPVADDETPSDNGASLRQTVVNSFDPNDKRCLEGNIITPEMVGDYVHYMIRFENTGTASAINVVVKDEIDTSKFDINTLVPMHASHNFVTRIQNTNEVEFVFENINLPFDDATNDGFVVFKIKTLNTLVLGDTFANDAEIYFDFNAPIITNDFVTAIAENLSVSDFELNLKVTLYPNPVNDMLYIASEISMDSASVYDIHGRELQTTIFVGNETQRAIDVNQLSRGTYFVTFTSEHGKITQKIIKN